MPAEFLSVRSLSAHIEVLHFRKFLSILCIFVGSKITTADGLIQMKIQACGYVSGLLCFQENSSLAE